MSTIDWELLREAKQELVTVVLEAEAAGTRKRYDLLYSILLLVDGIQDDAVEEGTATEAEVFGIMEDDDEN